MHGGLIADQSSSAGSRSVVLDADLAARTLGAKPTIERLVAARFP